MNENVMMKLIILYNKKWKIYLLWCLLKIKWNNRCIWKNRPQSVFPTHYITCKLIRHSLQPSLLPGQNEISSLKKLNGPRKKTPFHDPPNISKKRSIMAVKPITLKQGWWAYEGYTSISQLFSASKTQC
jgi:hypothetical protein